MLCDVDTWQEVDNKEEGVDAFGPRFVRRTKEGGALNPGSSHHCLVACRIILIKEALLTISWLVALSRSICVSLERCNNGRE